MNKFVSVKRNQTKPPGKRLPRAFLDKPPIFGAAAGLSTTFCTNFQKCPFPTLTKHSSTLIMLSCNSSPQKKITGPLSKPVLCVSNRYLAAKPHLSMMAAAPQTSEQAPHSEHASGSITYLPSPSLMAPEAHSSRQAPQLTQSSVITNISYNPPLIFIATIANHNTKHKRFTNLFFKPTDTQEKQHEHPFA
jgi:hypothetical protein